MFRSRKLLMLLCGLCSLAGSEVRCSIISDDVMLIVLSQRSIGIKDLGRCACVSKDFRKLADSDRAWAHLLPTMSDTLSKALFEHCLSIQSIKNELTHLPHGELKYPVLMNKMRCRALLLLPTRVDSVKADITALLNQQQNDHFHHPNKELTDEFYLFAIPYAPSFLNLYISTQATDMLEGQIDDPDEEIVRQNRIEVMTKVFSLLHSYADRGWRDSDELYKDMLGIASAMRLDPRSVGAK